MTFDEFIDKYHLDKNTLEQQTKVFTLEDMRACWEAAANRVVDILLDEVPKFRGKTPMSLEEAAKTHFPFPREPQWEDLPHRPEDEV